MNTSNEMNNSIIQELNELKHEYEILKLKYENDIKKQNINEPVKSEDSKTLRQLLDDYLKMYATRDDNLTTYFSDNFSGFTGGGDFLVKDKAEWIAITRQDFAQVKEPLRIELKDVSIQALNETIAVATSFFKIHLPIKDHILSRETARLVLIFCKESTGWKITHSSISIPYYLVREGEVYPLQELTERNQYLNDLVTEKTNQLIEANNQLQMANENLAKEISEQKELEKKLQLSNQKWEAIISASPDGIGMISLDGKMQLMSDKLAEMFGYSKEEKDCYIGKHAFDFIDTSNHEKLNENFQKLIKGERDLKISEYLSIKKDNSRFYVELNSALLLDAEGKPANILFIERDITERKKVEMELRQSYQKWEAIISASPDGIGMISLDGTLQFISDKLAKIFGYTVEEKNEMIGKSALNFIDPSDHNLMMENIRLLLSGKKDHKLTEYLAIKKDGTRFFADVNSTVLFDSNGKPESILYSQRDITERKRTDLIIEQQNKELQQLNATKDKFFSIVAHDLRSPFQGFIGLTELMAEDVTRFSLTELSDFTKGMHNTASNLYKLLQNLLEWARMQQGIESFRQMEIVLSEIVSQNIDLIHKTGEQKGINIILEVPENQKVYADEAMLNSVLRNLLSNAIKFTKRGGEVTISSAAIENNMVQITVTDNGIGIPEDLIAKLFKIEEKVGRKGTDGEETTGLGLLLCKEFVEKNGGKIWTISREGNGSKFYFTLPSMRNDMISAA